MPDPKFETFAERLTDLRLTQPDLAVAVLWFHDHLGPEAELTANALAKILNESALASGVNVSRLATQLSRHPDTVRGANRAGFRIRLASRKALDGKYLPFLGTRRVDVKHAYLPESQTSGTRPYLIKLAWQLNGCYENAFFDGCAVLCRRLVETLLIEAFETSGKGAAIKNGADYKPLSDIIALAKSGHHIRLARNTGRALDKIKLIGDTAAHDRTYITSQPDLDDLALEFRRVISELMNLANIHPTP